MNWLKRLPEAPVTSVLLALNVLVYVVMAILGHQSFQFAPNTLVLAGANVVVGPAQAIEVSHWRLLTAAFVHVNLIHIFMNMMFLVQLGVLSERFVGGGLVAGGYVAAGVFGNLVSTIWATTHGTPLLSAGASGGLMGLLGLVAVLAWFADIRPLAMMLLRNAGFIIVLGLALSLSGRGFMDNGAHIGGFVAGAGIGWARSRIRRPLSRQLNAALFAAAFTLVAIAFLVVIPARGAH